jgi:hypothetical protein
LVFVVVAVHEIPLPKFFPFFASFPHHIGSLTLREEHRPGVFENRVLRRIFAPKRDEVTGGWRKLHNEELHNLYSSPSIIRVIKSRTMRWAWYVARMGRKGMQIGFWLETQKEKDH